MVYDEEKAHGEPTILSAPYILDRPLRPLTTDEKLAATSIDVEGRDDSRGASSEGEVQDVYQGVTVKQDNGILSRLRRLETALDKKFGIEAEAIDRKLPSDRRPLTWQNQLSMSLLWASGTMNLSCFATGFLGWEFGLSLKQSILICLFASMLGGALPGFCATMGPATGLRQISIGRYSFGWWPNKIIAALNTIQQVGWSSVSCITGGVALVAVSDGTIPIAVGIVIIAVLSLIVSLTGLKVILVYERWAWAIYLVIFLIIFGETGRYTDNKTPASGSSLTISGNLLSLIAVVYGSSASWATVASDYYVLYPANVSRTKVFIFTTLGISLPTAIGMIAGCVVSFTLNNRADWHETYENDGVGFLLQQALYPYGFAKFLLVLLVLSGINCNIINTYSAAISCQQFARPFARIPRFIWTILCFGVIIALALAGRNSLLTYLQNFLSLLGYWCTSYFVIVFSEHYVFRKGNFYNYDLEGWNDPSKLPLGIAGFTAFALGVVVWCMGMVETWYIGPIGKMIGEYGGDVANELAFVVSSVSYVPVRWLELRYFGR
ncbi:putative nucleoside transporter [Teratosphaeria nubilosa]|uniref:Putative nucleoside transporter n=1 Tax=Teratosphaeria nubilosa TaxID=161662 RepID=A0A6G1LAB4_9PEZI|nr:putative nucleoside transporter [Teratosphaeria nubilosa]